MGDANQQPREGPLRDMATSIGVVVSVWLGVLTLLSLAGALSGSVRIIALAGLGWWLTCGAIYLFASVGKQTSERLRGTLATISERLQTLTQGHPELVPGAVLLDPIARIAGFVAYCVASLCYVTMGVVGTTAGWLTDLHLWLQRGGDVGTTVANGWSLIQHPGISALLTVTPTVVGVFAQLQQVKNEGWLQRGVRVMSSLELARSCVLMAAGLWGASVFHAADRLFAKPAILLPFAGVWNADVASQTTLLVGMGLPMFWLLWFIIPVLILALTRRTPAVVSVDSPDTAQAVRPSRTAPRTICVSMIVTALSTGYSTNEFRFWWDYWTSRNDPTDMQFYGCVAPNRLGSTALLMPCLADAEASFTKRLDGLASFLAERLSQKDLAAFKRKLDGFRERTGAVATKLKEPGDTLQPDAAMARLSALRTFVRSQERFYGVRVGGP